MGAELDASLRLRERTQEWALPLVGKGGGKCLSDYKPYAEAILSFDVIGITAECEGEGEGLEFFLHHGAYAPVAVQLGFESSMRVGDFHLVADGSRAFC